MGELGREKKGMWGLVPILSPPSKHHKQESRAKTKGWADMHNSKRKGYIPRITASRHFIGRASLVISLARSISLQSGTRERWGQLEGFCYAMWPVQPFCTIFVRQVSRREVGPQRIGNNTKYLLQEDIKSKAGVCHMLLLLPRNSLKWVAAKLLTGQPGFSGRPQHQCIHK